LFVAVPVGSIGGVSPGLLEALLLQTSPAEHGRGAQAGTHEARRAGSRQGGLYWLGGRCRPAASLMSYVHQFPFTIFQILLLLLYIFYVIRNILFPVILVGIL